MKRPMTGKAKNRGFTLIELIVVMLVAAILAAWGVPFWRSLMSSQRIKTGAFDMMSLVVYTRSEAMIRNSNVTLNYDPATGFKVTQVVNGVTNTLRTKDPLSGIKVDCVDTTANPHAYTACPAAGLTYNSYGRLTGTFPPIELHANVVGGTSDTAKSNYRCIAISLSGQPITTKGPC